MEYHIYHIPGKKIGVTQNLEARVHMQQGYLPGEYEVLETSDDIDFISDREILLQKEYGYRIDRKLYKNLNKETKRMKINVTEQTTTFPCPVNKLKGQLLDNMGMEWETEHGTLNITKKTVDWIMKNVKTSMYNNNRCYVYNKAFARLYDNNVVWGELTTNEHVNVFDKIRSWADVRGIYEEGNAHTQYVKLQEEAGELAKALLEDNHEEIVDAIGDMVVVLTNLAHLNNVNIETCVASAYNQIKNRKGEMINGTFVKDER